jgi:hypothetical protein
MKPSTLEYEDGGCPIRCYDFEEFRGPLQYFQFLITNDQIPRLTTAHRRGLFYRTKR